MTDTTAGVAGFSTVVLTKIFNIVPVQDMGQAFALGIVGALGGIICKEAWSLGVKFINKQKKK